MNLPVPSIIGPMLWQCRRSPRATGLTECSPLSSPPSISNFDIGSREPPRASSFAMHRRSGRIGMGRPRLDSLASTIARTANAPDQASRRRRPTHDAVVTALSRGPPCSVRADRIGRDSSPCSKPRRSRARTSCRHRRRRIPRPRRVAVSARRTRDLPLSHSI